MGDKNKERVRERSRLWHINNKERRKKLDHERYLKNKDKHIKAMSARHKQRYKEDEMYRIKWKFREALRSAFRRIKANKPAKTETLLGCSWEEARLNIESKFLPGMSWENHGKWHLDHIRPVSNFGLDELDKMNHINNLQPLWAADNLHKSSKYLDVSSDESDNSRTIREEVVEQGPRKENSSIV
jgi:hypothetical protein